MKPFEIVRPSDTMATYTSFMASEEWARLRDYVIKRDGGKCRICGCRGGQEVHHIRYQDEDGVERLNDPDWLVTLCGPCHDIITKAVQTANEINVTVTLPIGFAKGRWRATEDKLSHKVDVAIYGAYKRLVVDTLFNLWRRTLAPDAETVNMRDLKVLYRVGKIVTDTLENQAQVYTVYGTVHYAADVISRITNYLADAYNHYMEQGVSEAEFRRMFKLAPDKMPKVRENARRRVEGGGNGRQQHMG